MTVSATGPRPAAPAKPERLLSLDAFRGLTILVMVFVIAVAAFRYEQEAVSLPQRMEWFGSLPVSTWFHAEVGYNLWEQQQLAAGATPEQIAQMPEHRLKGIGVTVTDLVAPWFVFIVGVAIPLSRQRRGADFWRHALWRTALLILVGVLYLSLVIRQISWWWGVLQAIGIAYLCGALVMKLPSAGRWAAVLIAGGLNLALTETTSWWTGAWEGIVAPFGTLQNPGGNWLLPLSRHCQPWLSISYGVMTMIGVLVGEVIVTREPRRIAARCLLVAAVFMGLGYGLHRAGFATGNHSLCMSKPDVTTSYAFFTAGFGALVFLVFHWVIDVWKIRAWTAPLRVFGVNPLLAYFMMIGMRRFFDAVGITSQDGMSGFFSRVTEQNAVVMNWATWIGGGQPSQAVLDFFDKGGYQGVMWGLVWTALLWLIVLWFNRRQLYWKL
ncbi:MAG: DUF1624 domain-containing protein [Candidatus Sumerlaeia bacterium]|nr:DUF1624 domain-containing protein [Candidatus Sumerlaeia bacterium]